MFRIITVSSILFALAAVLFLAAPSPPAQAQSNTVTSQSLVSNLGETRTAYRDMNSDHAQSFRTGAHSAGYLVTSVDLDLTIAAGHSPFTVAIHGHAGGAHPGIRLAQLTAPESLATGLNRFTVSGSLVLQPSGRYWVVIDAGDGGTRTGASVAYTTSDDDDSDEGWFILNGSRNRGHQATIWQKSGDAYQMRVNGKQVGLLQWDGDGFQIVSTFIQNQSARLLLPAATGDGPLTYNLRDTRDNNTQPIPTTLTLPAGLTFDPVSRMISGTPTKVESDAWNYSVTDRHGQQKDFNFLIGVKAAPEYSTLSVIPRPDALDVVWTPSADTGVTGYLVQWKSGDQEFSDTVRTHTTGATASSYQIANPEFGAEYAVKVTQQGGRYDGDSLTRRVSTWTNYVTLVRGGPAKTYQARLNKQPPVGGAVYPKQALDEQIAWFRWDTGERLRPPRPVLYFFTANDPTQEELAKRPSNHPPMKWDTLREFSLQARDDSGTGTVPIYHEFIWDDDPCTGEDGDQLGVCTLQKRPDFTAGTVIVTIVNPPLTGLTVAAVPGEPTQLSVSWNPVSGATKYSVAWTTGSDGLWASVDKTTTSHTITGLAANTTYTVHVEALNASDTKLAEGTGEATTVAASSAPPESEPTQDQEPAGTPALANLTAASVSGQPTQLAVSWDESQGATKYSVRWKTGSNDYGDAVETTTNSYTITGLTANTTYTVNVAALDADNTLLAEGTTSGETEPSTGEANDPPTNTPASGAPTISGTAQVGETLTADTSGISDADGLANATFSYQWLADGSDISGATSSTYSPVAGDVGKAIKVTVSFTDDAGNAESLTSAATDAVVATNTPASGAPTISGTAQVGETLTAATSGISDADGLTNATFSYQWLADGSDISGATSNTYTLVSGDVGKVIKVTVSFTDDAGNAESLTSTATAAVAKENPAEDEPAVSFVIYHDPNAGDEAVDRYNQGVKLLKDAGLSYSEVIGDVQDDVDRLAGVTGSVLPRFFLSDPTDEDWVSETKVNNGGLRWLKGKVAELSGD